MIILLFQPFKEDDFTVRTLSILLCRLSFFLSSRDGLSSKSLNFCDLWFIEFQDLERVILGLQWHTLRLYVQAMDILDAIEIFISNSCCMGTEMSL